MSFILGSLAWRRPERLTATKAGEGEEKEQPISPKSSACTSMPKTPNTPTGNKVNFQNSMSWSKTTKEMKNKIFLKFPLKK